MTSKRNRFDSLAGILARLAVGGTLLIGGLFLAGCETTAGSGPSSAKAETPKTVAKGMTEADVLAILGEPKEVEEVYENEVAAQIWRYEKEVVLNSTIESDGEQERVYADPDTGQFVTVREPIYRNSVVRGTIVAEILFVNGEVVAMKEKEGPAAYDVNHGQR